jgi:Xaa-Pro aminopeptidase
MSRHEQRRDRVRRQLRALAADGILVTNFKNVTYLTGFSGDDSYLLITPHNDLLLTDPRYTQQMSEECPDLELAVRQPGTEIIALVERVVKAARLRHVAFESGSLTVANWARLTKDLDQVELIPTENVVEQLREIKDQEEVGEIREAIVLAERAFAVVRASLRPEQTEKELAYELENQIRRFGGAGCSFQPIVGVGPRGALPHATLSDHQVGESDFVLVDWGARGRLYMSDLTRVLVTGRISPKLERIYDVVLRAQAAGIAAIRPGAVLKDVDAAARKVIEDAGFGPRFGHGLGHGIGLEIHESPRFAANQDRQVKAGMVVTVEPGIYLPGWGGIRLEDDILVTRTGHEVLSRVPRELGHCLVT